jgi:hypothetical protein
LRETIGRNFTPRTQREKGKRKREEKISRRARKEIEARQEEIKNE